MTRFASAFRKVLMGKPRALARQAQARAASLGLTTESDREAFLSRFAIDQRRGNVVLGAFPHVKEDHWIGLPAPELVRRSGMICGATGGGKSVEAQSIEMQLIPCWIPIIHIDPKGEGAQDLTTWNLPALYSWGLINDQDLEHIRVIRPFDTDTAPPLNVTLPEPGVDPAVQTLGIVTAVEDALNDPFGGRMQRAARYPIKLAIELGRPLTWVRRWLGNPTQFARDAQLSADPEIREYAHTGLPRENKASLEALVARLDNFLFLPQTCDALEAPTCVDFGEALESGLTIVDLGGAPAGLESVLRFWSGIIVGKLQRAILSRPVTDTTPWTWLLIDEAPVIISARQAVAFERLISLARFRKVGIWAIAQLAAQFGSADSLLAKSIETNIRISLNFRCNPDDARRSAGALAAGKDRSAATNVLSTLPDRHFLLHLRDSGHAPQILRSPRMDLGRIRRAAESVAPKVRERIRTGSIAVPRNSKRGNRPLQVLSAPQLPLPTPDEMKAGDELYPELG